MALLPSIIQFSDQTKEKEWANPPCHGCHALISVLVFDVSCEHE